MSLIYEYILEAGLFSDPLLYSIYFSVILSITFSCVLNTMIQPSTSFFTREVYIHTFSYSNCHKLQVKAASVVVINWMAKALKRKEDTGEEDSFLVIQCA